MRRHPCPALRRNAYRAASQHAGAPDRLGDRALHAGADVVTLLPLVGQLLAAPRFKRLLLVPGKQGQAAASSVVRRLGAFPADRATAAVLGCEVHPREGSSAALSLVGPAGADLSLGAGDLAGLPVDGEGALREVLAFAGFVAGVQCDRPANSIPYSFRAVTMCAAVT